MRLHPTILEADGKPAFVVLPYDEYIALTSKPRIPEDDTIPHEVVERMIANDWSLVRAWRDYLGLTQDQVAERLSVSQPSYARMESPKGAASLRSPTIRRIAAAFGISAAQVSVDDGEG